MNIFIRAFLIIILSWGQINLSFAQTSTASLIPNAVQQFFDNNGNPLTSGSVTFYLPGTSTLAPTWKNAAETILNTNPVRLDAGGKAIIYGNQTYRQLVKDRNDNIIWDAVTAPGGSGGGSVPVTIGDGNMVGTILLWSNFVVPPQYVLAYGQEIARVTYPAYLAAVTSVQSVFCTSGSPILTGLADTTQFPIGARVEVGCVPSLTAAIISKTTSTITLDTNANISITLNATIFPYGNGNGTSTFNVQDWRGRVPAGRDNMGDTPAGRLTTSYFGANASAIGAPGGLESEILTIAQMPAHDHSGETGNQTTSTTARFFYSGNVVNTAGATPSISQLSGTAGPAIIDAIVSNHHHSIASQGGGLAHSIVQPTITTNYIVKVTPDTSSLIASGVASLGGMTGIVACGAGLNCSSNTISVNATASQLTVGSTPVVSGTSNYILYNNAGILGNLPTTGIAGNVVLSNSPTIATPTLTGSNFITNVNLTTALATTIKGNPTNATAAVQDFTIQGLTTATLNASNDFIPVYNAATGTIRKTTPSDIAAIGTLPTISNRQILANTSGGAATPIGTNGTTWFDNAYCNTVGYVIARLVSVWTCSQGLPINMAWMGADNTGVVNASTIIQNTITANTAGNCLFFPAGSYLFTGITSSNQVCITGVGGGAGPGQVSPTYATIFLNSSNTGTLFHITSYYASIFRDFQITAASGTPTAGIGIYLDSSGGSNQTRSQITGVGFFNVYTGIQILRPFFPVIDRNYFQVWGNYGIIMTTTCTVGPPPVCTEGGGGMITNNVFFGDYPTVSSTAAIYSEVGYIDINNNAILGGPYGIFIGINNNPAGFIKIHDNTIENFGIHGILLSTLDGSTASMVMIQNNEFSVFTKTPSSCMFVADYNVAMKEAWITGVQIQGNVCQNTTAVGGRAGVWLGAGKNVNISNNIINELGSNSPLGISVGGATTNAGLLQPIQVLDNSFSGGTLSAKYSVSATGIPVIRDLSSNMTVAQAIAVGAANGSQFYATDATVPSSSPCVGGGAGSLLLIESGTSRCP